MAPKNSKGFTMVELMIVVSIIGLLAAIAVPKFGDMLEKAREGATKSGQSSIRSAIATYYADQGGVYPTTLDTNTSTVGGQSFPPYIPNYLNDLPPVKVTAKNRTNTAPGKGPGALALADYVTTGTYNVPAFVTDGTGQGWKYNNLTGWVWVNSGQIDMAGTSYTSYGLE
jgi:prepilin-type N-terminal cleavage/methylation domain-containing protein